MEGKLDGAKLVVVDPRMSNTAAHADLWVAPWPGSEAAILLAIASYLLRTGQVDRAYLERWLNWDVYLENLHPDAPRTFETFLERLTDDYAPYTFEIGGAGGADPRRAHRGDGADRRRSATAGWLRTSGARRRPATTAGGRSRARCGSCSP